MDSRQKLGISLYALLYALVALVGFRLGGVVPDVTIYLLVTGLFLTLLWIAVRTESSAWLASALALSLVVLLGLLVVDPLEVGFYGYDPYYTLRALKEFRTEGLLWLANNRGAWPAFYAYTWTVTSLLGLEPMVVGKYLPMVAGAIPVACLVAVRRLANVRTAFVAAIGVTGVRTLVGFEMKFVDETVAATLFFFILTVLAIQRGVSESSRIYTILLSLFAVTAILTHHYVGLLVTVLLCFWAVSQTEFVGRVVPSIVDVNSPSSSTRTAALVASVVFVIVLAVVANSFIFWALGTVDVNVSSGGISNSDGGSVTTTVPQTSTDSSTQTTSSSTTSESTDTNTPTTEAAGGGETSKATTALSGKGSPSSDGGSEPLFSQFTQHLFANIVILGLFVLVAVTFLTGHTYERHSLALTAFSGILAALYGWSIAFGRIIPLDPSRYVLFMVASVLIVGAIRISRIDSSVLIRVFSVAVAALVVTQMALLSPAVWYSDQSNTIVGEGHYSPSQFATSDWVASYAGDSVVGWEGGVWLYRGIYLIDAADNVDRCGPLHVWRGDRDHPRPTGSVLYDAGQVALYTCDSTVDGSTL